MVQRRKRSSVASMVGAAALSLLLVGPAVAAGDTTSATVTGGELSITTPLADDFEGRSITGADQLTTASLAAFTVSDLRGSGAGWHVTVDATQFTGVSHNLATGSLTMSAPTVASPDTLSPDPTINTGPYTIDVASPVTIASAAIDTGMGNYDFSATTLTLSLPADVYADTYTSTVTLTAVSAP